MYSKCTNWNHLLEWAKCESCIATHWKNFGSFLPSLALSHDKLVISILNSSRDLGMGMAKGKIVPTIAIFIILINLYSLWNNYILTSSNIDKNLLWIFQICFNYIDSWNVGNICWIFDRHFSTLSCLQNQFLFSVKLPLPYSYSFL